MKRHKIGINSTVILHRMDTYHRIQHRGEFQHIISRWMHRGAAAGHYPTAIDAENAKSNASRRMSHLGRVANMTATTRPMPLRERREIMLI